MQRLAGTALFSSLILAVSACESRTIVGDAGSQPDRHDASPSRDDARSSPKSSSPDAATDGLPADAGCMATVEATLVFYESACVGWFIRCDGVEVPASPDDMNPGFCDVPGITCAEPATDTSVLHYSPSGRSCAFCSHGDDTPDIPPRCQPLPRRCGSFTIRHVVTGSAATGPAPWPSMDCSDSGRLDAGADTQLGDIP